MLDAWPMTNFSFQWFCDTFSWSVWWNYKEADDKKERKFQGENKLSSVWFWQCVILRGLNKLNIKISNFLKFKPNFNHMNCSSEAISNIHETIIKRWLTLFIKSWFVHHLTWSLDQWLTIKLIETKDFCRSVNYHNLFYCSFCFTLFYLLLIVSFLFSARAKAIPVEHRKKSKVHGIVFHLIIKTLHTVFVMVFVSHGRWRF